jgi:hypothetical protein
MKKETAARVSQSTKKDENIIEYILLFSKLNEFERARILGRMQERVEIRKETERESA